MGQIMLWIWSCDQSLLTLAFLWLNIIRIWPEKPIFFEGCSWFNFNKLVTRYCLGILHSRGKRVETKGQKVLEAISNAFRRDRGKSGRVVFLSPMLNRVNVPLNSCNFLIIERYYNSVKSVLMFFFQWMDLYV